ncbi:hypothetical protein QI060_00230 [Staphylococcus saprophyticus]|uniref:Uncharacterized protein n=1 Tax=uncultured Caudovirales phage TaxID=2100421 RepID=A0A2H4JC81_9CAUD|nr:hypothetical protein 10F4_9 [uncultured Caudovirales phage]MDW4300732.1 hypothetical protein [Staphylococcus saprophyticus]
MQLSNTIDIRYKYKTGGMNTKEMAQLLKYYGFRGYLKSVNQRSFTVAVLPEDKAHNRKVLNKLKGVMASETKS